MPPPLPHHPLADIFPMMNAGQSDALLADIRTNGVLSPIVIHEGKILDGRHRYTLAQQLGVECPSIEFTGADPLAFVISANLARRHLTTKQRAALATDLANMRLGANQHAPKEGRPNGLPSPAMSIEQAAAAMNVSPRSVRRAIAVKRADPEAHERAKRGKAASTPEPKAPLAPPKPRYRAFDIAAEEGALISSKTGSATMKFKARVEAADPGLEIHNPLHEDRLRRAAREYAAQRRPAQFKRAQEGHYQDHRRKVEAQPETAQQKIDRLVERELKLRNQMIDQEVREAAKALVPETVALYERLASEAAKRQKEYTIMRKAIPAQMTPEEYRFLLNVLHPDRAPADRRAKFAMAFDIVRKLDEYISVVAKGR